MGLIFVFSAGSDALLGPFDRGLNGIYLEYSFFNSITRVVFHGSLFHPFPSHAFPKFLTDCTPLHGLGEVNMVRQKLVQMMMTCSLNKRDIAHGELNFSVLSWRYITSLCSKLSVLASTKKAVSAAHGVDDHFFLIHHKKRGWAEMALLNNLQYICAAVTLFGRNIGIGVHCHPS